MEKKWTSVLAPSHLCWPSAAEPTLNDDSAIPLSSFPGKVAGTCPKAGLLIENKWKESTQTMIDSQWNAKQQSEYILQQLKWGY